jgi:predicted TIM-barrel fold metal-dependent hydrolase
VDGSTGFVAGYFTREAESGTRTIGHVHLGLSRGADGVWRIATETAQFPGPRTPEEVPAERLIAELDAGGIQRAAVLSTAYWYASANGEPAENEHESVRAENDWIAAQVARFPGRLVGFCSFNPLREYALQELARCADNPHLKGVKLHFGDSGVNVLDPQHVQKMREVFRAANEHRLAIVVHLMGPDPGYGRAHSEAFLSQIVPAAPDIPIQIAHMAGSGPYYNSDSAFAVFSEAAAAGDPRMKNVWVDVATVVTLDMPAEALALVARRLRELGLERVLYASDSPASPEFTGDKGWVYFRRLPFTDEEFRTVADNLAPYLR